MESMQAIASTCNHIGNASIFESSHSHKAGQGSKRAEVDHTSATKRTYKHNYSQINKDLIRAYLLVAKS